MSGKTRNAELGPPDVGATAGDLEGRAGRILAAAAALMSERGLDGTSVQAIADRADVNKALVFYYFGNKTKLFAKIFEHYLEGLHAALERSLAEDESGPRSALDKLHAVVDAYSDYIEDHPSYPRLVQRELANAQGRHDLLTRHNARNYELVRSALGELTDDAGPAAAHQLFASVVGMILYYHLAAPVMLPVVDDPASPEAREERRAHIHWAVDALVAALRCSR
ncbi:MAG TPA: TetR/AcrR family transcriptional regulator [Polyangiaceae bacterium]|nr:TetR/AcrR family transcriptional regulator [Polyangiaceae bacterium]